MSAPVRKPNRLIHESSPYLRQHAWNPVDWYPWCDEAIQRAQAEDKPIFLSIGYAACHWCHVMGKESFDDEETAQILNEHFVSIKVDREERPDLDHLYMNAVVMLTGHGGWPLTVFLTPDLKPFYGGTYFPPEDRANMPSFRRILLAVAIAYRHRRQEVERAAQDLVAHLRRLEKLPLDQGALDAELLRQAYAGDHGWRRHLDPVNGGTLGAPKFPQPVLAQFLLRLALRFADPEPLEHAQRLLDHMSRGGIFDHLAGGFHRYSTDAQWLVPHFEKMLYDNALLAAAYLEAYQLTGAHPYRQVVEQTLRWLLEELAHPGGGFASSLDADSEGEEGKYYLWTWNEVHTVLGSDLGELFCQLYQVSPEGNWEGQNILHLARPLSVDARLMGRPVEELEEWLARARAQLLAYRRQRTPPARDDKILTSWNGLALSALARAALALHPSWLDPAVRTARFLYDRMRLPDGRLNHVSVPGCEPARPVAGMLEDYSYVIEGLLDLYEVTADAHWLDWAGSLAQVMVELFWDDQDEGFYVTAPAADGLPVRAKDWHDGATPAGNSVALADLDRLAHYTGDRRWADLAARGLRRAAGLMRQAPTAVTRLLVALDFHLGPLREWAVLAPQAEQLYPALHRIGRHLDPRRVLVGYAPGLESTAVAARLVPWLAGKSTIADQLTVYMCEGTSCRPPAVGVQALEQLLTSVYPPDASVQTNASQGTTPAD